MAADGIDVVDAAYDMTRPRPERLHAIGEAAARTLLRRHAVTVFEFRDDYGFIDGVVVNGDDRLMERCLRAQAGIPPPIQRAIGRASPFAYVVSDTHVSAAAMAEAERLGIAHTLALHGGTCTSGGLGVGNVSKEPFEWPRQLVDHCSLIATHLGAAHRLRARFATPEGPRVTAALRTDGRVAEGVADATAPTARELLRRAVLAREAARSRLRGRGSATLWPALVAGRWTLLDAFTASGTRYVVAYENPPGAAHLRALSSDERRVVEWAQAGRAGKWIALELGISEATVTRLLRRALRRLGANDLLSLAGVRAAMMESFDGLSVSRLGPLTRTLGCLTRAEREIATAMIAGRSRSQIASLRRTSVRTVAHQIESIYRKLGIGSRRELLACLG